MKHHGTVAGYHGIWADIWVPAKVGGEEATTVDTEGGHLGADTLIWRATSELGIDLVKETADIVEELKREVGEVGLLLFVLGGEGQEVCQVGSPGDNIAKPWNHSHAEICQVLAVCLVLLEVVLTPLVFLG